MTRTSPEQPVQFLLVESESEPKIAPTLTQMVISLGDSKRSDDQLLRRALDGFRILGSRAGLLGGQGDPSPELRARARRMLRKLARVSPLTVRANRHATIRAMERHLAEVLANSQPLTEAPTIRRVSTGFPEVIPPQWLEVRLPDLAPAGQALVLACEVARALDVHTDRRVSFAQRLAPDVREMLESDDWREPPAGWPGLPVAWRAHLLRLAGYRALGVPEPSRLGARRRSRAGQKRRAAEGQP